MADISKQIRMCVDTGKVKFGERDALKASLNGSARLILISSNMKQDVRSDLEHNAKISGIPVIEFSGTGYELGSVCGVPYTVSALCVFDQGNSTLVSDFAKKQK